MELCSAGAAPLLADVGVGVLLNPPMLVPAPEVPESGAAVLVGDPMLDGDAVLDVGPALMALFWRS